MSGGSQHNPNGRQSQLGPGWSPLQLQVANFLARAPPVHMAPDRGVTWHTPTPPPHLYHVPAPSPPDPLQGLLQLQAMKTAGNSVFRHTATPPELYRHTPTPPDKHLMRHTPSPGDIKGSTVLPPADIYPHLGPARDKLVRAEELVSYARGGVDLSLGGGRGANGAAGAALSVRDAPTINSLIARAAPRPSHARVDALLERLAPNTASAPAPAPVPHTVIVHPRVQPTPSPPSSNEDSADSCGAPPGSKRKRKPERTVRVPSALPPPAPSEPRPPPAPAPAPATPPAPASPRKEPAPPPPLADPAPPPAAAPPPPPLENGDTTHAKLNGPDEKPPSPKPHVRRKSRSGSAETIADIAAMIADPAGPAPSPLPAPAAVASVASLESVLAGPEPAPATAPGPASPPAPEEPSSAPVAAAPSRRSARTSNSEATNVPVESPSEAKPAEPETSDAHTAEPTAASFVEVENQLEKMFAGLEEAPAAPARRPPARKRRRSAPRPHARRKPARAKPDPPRLKRTPKDHAVKDAYDSGSNASSSRSRGPYIQIRGARDSPASVTVMNAWTGEEEGEGRRREEWRAGGGGRRGLHASTLGLRYDAHTRDVTWLCAFCGGAPHTAGLGDLFGPYTLHTDCEEYRALDEATRRRYAEESEVWFHAGCAVWAPGLVAAGARVWGLAPAVWGARAERCGGCGRAGAALACSARPCRARAHLPCARAWTLHEDLFQAVCPRHA